MRWPGEVRRAEEFARLLDDPGARAEPELAGLVAVAGRLRDLPIPGPSADFRARLRRQLIDEATERLPAVQFDLRMRPGTTGPLAAPPTGPAPGTDRPRADAGTDLGIDPVGGPEPGAAGEPTAVISTGAEPDTDAAAEAAPEGGGAVAPGRRPATSRPGRRRDAPRPGRDLRHRRRPRIGMGAVTLVLVVLAGAAIAGSRDALPGDALYGVKRGTENAQLALARGDEHRGMRYMDLARTRLREITALAGRGEAAADIAQTLATMDEQTADGVRLLTTTAVDQVDDGLLVRIGNWTVEQYRLVLAAAPGLPAAARTRAGESVALLRRVGGRVLALRGLLGCSCLASAGADDLGPQTCNPCASGGRPAGATSTNQPRPTGPAGPAPTGPPARTTAPPAGGRPSTGGGGVPSRGPTGSTAGGGSGGVGLPIPLPTSGGNLPLPTIPGLPLPTSLPLPIPLPTLSVPTSVPSLPLPTGLFPGLLPGS